MEKSKDEERWPNENRTTPISWLKMRSSPLSCGLNSSFRPFPLFISMPPKATAAKRKHAAAAAAPASAPAAAAAADSIGSKKAKTVDSTTATTAAAPAAVMAPLQPYHILLSALNFGALFSTDVDPLHLFPADSPWRRRIDAGVVPFVRQKKQKKIAGVDGQTQRDFLRRFKEELGTTLLPAATESEAAVLAAEDARAADAAGKKKVLAGATSRARGWFRDGRLEARIRLSVDIATDYNPATEGGELDANLTVRALVHSDSPADTALIYLHYDSDELGGEAALLTRGSEVYAVAHAPGQSARRSMQQRFCCHV
jgi:hypothetical protein